MTTKRVLTAATLLRWVVPALAIAFVPGTAFAEGGHGADSHGDHGGVIEEGYGADAAEEAHDEHGGAHGGHGSLSFTEIIQGEHSLEFWGAVVNFVLLLLVLRKLGKQPLQNFLTNRSKSVEDGMQEAAALKAEAQRVFDEYSARLKTMDTEIEQLKQDIRTAAEADKQRIIDEAKRSAERMHADTENLIAQQSRELADDVRAKVVSAAMAAAEEVIRQAMSKDEQQVLAQNFVGELAQEPASDLESNYQGGVAQLGGHS